MKRIVAFILCLSLIILAGPAAAAPAEDQAAQILHGNLSLPRALELALEQNRQLQGVMKEKDAARGRILEACQGFLPNISLDGTWRRQDRDHKMVGGTNMPLGQEDNYVAEVNVIQPLFHGGASSAGLKAARLYGDLVDEQVRLAVQQTIFATIKAYDDVLLATQQLEVTRTNVNLARAHLDDVQVKRRFGAASDFHVLRSEVELSNARAQMLRYESDLHETMHTLLRILGVSQESDVVLSDSLTFEPLSVAEEETITRALANRPDLAAAGLTEDIRSKSLKVARSAYAPSVNAFYSYQRGNPDPYIPTRDEWDDMWNAGIKVSLPIFDGLGREGRVAQEKAAYQKSRIQHADAKEQVLFEVRTAWSSLRDAEALVKAQQLSVTQAQEGLRIAEAGYREGTIDQVSLLDARAALLQSQLIYHQSLYGHALSRVNLSLAEGTLNITTSTEGTQK